MKTPLLSIFALRWRALFVFAILFRIVEGLLFAPLVALAGKWLLGQTVLDSTAAVSFLLSPRGFLALVLAAVAALTIRLMEHAGLSAIFFGGFEGRRISGREALRRVRRKLPILVLASARFLGFAFLAGLPLIAVAGGFAMHLLAKHDVNYYLKLRPPEFVVGSVLIGVAAAVSGALLLSFIVRWRWVVQVVLFQNTGARAAFAESSWLTAGIRWRILGTLIVVVLVACALGATGSLLGASLASLALGVVRHGTVALAVSFGLLILLQGLISAFCTLLGSCIDAGIFTTLYRERVTTLGVKTSLGETAELRPSNLLRWLPAALTLAGLAVAVGGSWLALEALPSERPVTIHAHRGVTARAPENTLAAVREAIDAGADYVETDVQLSKDDVLVVAHDSDFSRLGGVARKVWELTYDEIRVIPLGARSAPEFRNEFAPTFDALLAEAKGRIKVNIELKYYGDHQPGLASKVIEAVRARGMLDQIVVQCLEYEPLLEVRRLAQEVPIGYLLSFNARKPGRLEVDFLSVEQNRVNRIFIPQAHRRGQQVYAWTVNTAEDMERLLDMGIDGVITDRAALARKTLDTYLSLTKAERAARQVRAWLAY